MPTKRLRLEQPQERHEMVRRFTLLGFLGAALPRETRMCERVPGQRQHTFALLLAQQFIRMGVSISACPIADLTDSTKSKPFDQ